ncbi:MAG: AMP-binding protein [Sphingomonadales bacterium]|nr:AMP-binding protein [Sphingomonadales bacterium]
MATQFHLADLFETIAATVPERPAIVSDALTLTYAQLDARTTALASGLAAHGVKRGDTVGLYMLNRPEHLEAFIAVIKLGAVPFNVNFRYRGDELAYLFANADAAAVIHDAQFAGQVGELRAALPALKVAVAVDDRSGTDCTGSLDYARLLETPPSGPWPRDESDILLTYTGGTTGMPKGVMWPHRAFFFACAGAGGYFNPHGPAREPGDIADRAANGYPARLFPVAPLMHAAAFWAVWSAMLNGLAIVIDDSTSFDPAHIWDIVARHRVNMVQIVGDAMAIPLRDALRDNPGRWDLSAVGNFGSGGAVFSRHVKDDIAALLPPGATITDGLGSSETGTSGQAEASAEGMMRLPGNDQQKVVVDGRFAVAGETGFIARSGNTPVGYYGDPVKSAEVFQTIAGQLWAVSGDAGRLDEDGMITVFGRGSTCINSGGEKIFPEEVEEALRAHPAILDAVVAGQPDPRWGERVVGVVALREGATEPAFDAVREFLRERLAGYKLPKALIWVDAVRRSPAGKQDYRWAKDLVKAAR